jgi:flagellar biosynthesis protein FliR
MFDTAHMFAWLFALFRAAGLLFVLPVFSLTSFPRSARLGFAALLAWIVAPAFTPDQVYPTGLLALALMVTKEVAVGVLMGFAVQLVFALLDFAAQIIAVEIGLQPGAQFDSLASAAGNPLGTGMFYLGIVIFFAGAQYAVIAAFARSFEIVPLGLPVVGVNIAGEVLRQTSRIIQLGVLMAAPFMAVNFLINLMFSILGRVVPRINVFILSFSIRALAGLAMLTLAAGLLVHYTTQEFGGISETMLRFMPFAAP